MRYTVGAIKTAAKNTVTRMFSEPISISIKKFASSFWGGRVENDPASNYVFINRFPFHWFASQVRKLYGTIKMTHMYEMLGVRWFGKCTIRIHKFFLPELLYILSKCGVQGRPEEIMAEIAEKTWVRDLMRPDSDFQNDVVMSRIDKTLKCTLYPWQTEFIQQYDIQRRRAHLNGELLSFGCGLGKTITTIALMKAIGADCVIVIAPKSTLKDVWVYHLEEFSRKKPLYWLVNEDKPKDAEYYITNYESMNKLDSVMSFIQRKKKVGIIVDESHNFLHLSSDRTKNLIELREKLRCQNVLMASGTPVKAISSEVIPLLRVIDDFFDEEAAVTFKKAFGVNTVLGTDIIHARLSMMMHRRKMEDVYQLPEKVERDLFVKIKDGVKYTIPNVKNAIVKYVQERKDYHDSLYDTYVEEWHEVREFLENSAINLSKDMTRYLNDVETFHQGYDSHDPAMVKEAKWVKDYERDVIIPMLPKDLRVKFEHCIAKYKYLLLVIRGEALGYLEKLRMLMTLQMIKGINISSIIDEALKKTIFFTSYVPVVELLDNMLDDLDYEHVSVYGETSKDSAGLLDKFRKDKDIQVLVATVQTLATGVTLTEANTIVFCNQLYRAADYEQASNRVWRLGQNTPCDIISLRLDTNGTPNLSDRNDEILKWSKELMDAIVDG